MINLTTYKIQKTIDFISIEGVPEVKLYIIPNAKSIETPEGNTQHFLTTAKKLALFL